MCTYKLHCAVRCVNLLCVHLHLYMARRCLTPIVLTSESLRLSVCASDATDSWYLSGVKLISVNCGQVHLHTFLISLDCYQPLSPREASTGMSSYLAPQTHTHARETRAHNHPWCPWLTTTLMCNTSQEVCSLLISSCHQHYYTAVTATHHVVSSGSRCPWFIKVIS